MMIQVGCLLAGVVGGLVVGLIGFYVGLSCRRKERSRKEIRYGK
jgi:hypothetical protein